MIIGIAGPYSAPTEKQRQENLDALNTAAARVLEQGHIPLVGVNAALPIIQYTEIDHDYEVIMSISVAVMQACEGLLVIGDSPGVQKEKAVFTAKGLPVYYSIDEIPAV